MAIIIAMRIHFHSSYHSYGGGTPASPIADLAILGAVLLALVLRGLWRLAGRLSGQERR